MLAATRSWRKYGKPGAPAAILYREEEDDDFRNHYHMTYVRMKILTEAGLPALPFFSVNLRVRSSGQSAVTGELARHIRDAFERRYPRKSHE